MGTALKSRLKMTFPSNMEFTFGVTIGIVVPNDDPEKPPEVKKYALTGRFPSPAFQDLEAVVSEAIEFFNGHLGTKLGAIRVFDEDELVEVAPGEFQPNS